MTLVLLAFSVAGAVLCFAKIRDIDRQNALALADIERLEAESKVLDADNEAVQKELLPDDRARLVGAHKLAASKSFGWSRLFADLERILPGSVSASRIGVENVFREGDRVKAELEFAVLSRDFQGVAAMIDNMNNSGVFRAELRGQDRQQNERGVYTEYTLRLIYTPTSFAPAVNEEPFVAQQQGGNQ